MAVRKVLVLCGTLNLDYYRIGSTPAMWQLYKGLYEVGCDLILLPYLGRAFRSLWWRCEKNPLELESRLYYRVAVRDQLLGGSGSGGLSIKLARTFSKRILTALRAVLARENDVDALLFAQVPVNHFDHVAAEVKREYDLPLLYYDIDLPVSLPSYGGFSFNHYVDADLSPFDAVVGTSEGVRDDVLRLGANRYEVVHFGADPDVYRPLSMQKDIDFFFSGVGVRFREDWIHSMIVQPSEKLPYRFVVSGTDYPSMSHVELLPSVPFNAWRLLCGRSKLNLNVTRKLHATVYASSTSRPFEYAAMGCCVISNPYNGLERWFDIGREMFCINDSEEAVELYKALIDDEDLRLQVGSKARARVLKEHTFKHRAQALVDIFEKV